MANMLFLYCSVIVFMTIVLPNLYKPLNCLLFNRKLYSSIPCNDIIACLFWMQMNLLTSMDLLFCVLKILLFQYKTRKQNRFLHPNKSVTSVCML